MIVKCRYILFVFLLVLIHSSVSAASTLKQPTSTETTTTITGQLDVTLRQAADIDLATKPKLTLKSTHEQFNLSAIWDSDGPHIGPYMFNKELPTGNLAFWGGGQAQETWADPFRLVRLPGVNHAGLRLRLTRDQWGIDTGAQTGLRWQDSWDNSSGKGKGGLLTLWGTSPADGDDYTEEDECSSNSSMDGDSECRVTVTDATTWSSDPMHWQRLALYATNSHDGLTTEGTLAWSATAKELTIPGYGWRVQYKQPDWSIEAKTVVRSAGYTTENSSASSSTVWRSGLKVNNTVFQLHRTGAISDESGNTNWRLYTGRGGSLSLDRSSSVFTSAKVTKASVPAWRLSFDWRPRSGADPDPSNYPYLLPDPTITYWKAVVEGLYPFGQKSGGVAARLSIGENKAGKLNWSYPKLISGRALSTQSDMAVCAEGMMKYVVAPDWNLGIEGIYGEEIRHKPVPGQLHHATFWSVIPSLEHRMADDLAVEISAGWSHTQEYTGVDSEETLQTIRFSIKI